MKKSPKAKQPSFQGGGGMMIGPDLGVSTVPVEYYVSHENKR
jgi:hypothetical protein